MSIPIHLAKEQELFNIGVAAAPPERLNDRLFDEIRRLTGFSRALTVMLESCTKCGACAKACHSYLGTEDTGNIPCVRADLLRSYYQRNFTAAGKLAAWLTGTSGCRAGELERWVDYAYQCNLCRRCTYFCPMGIDTTEITLAMRHTLVKLGIVPRFIAGIAANEIKAGTNTGILKPAMIDCCEFLEEELKEATGQDIRIPIDKPDAEVLFIPSSTEFATNVDTLMGAAKMFHALGYNWTLSSALAEAANYGFFIDADLMKHHNKRLLAAVRATGASLVIQGECGHGWRVAKIFSEGANGPIPFKLRHILEVAAENLDKLPLRKVEMRVTLHDSCNYARAGDLTEAPRRILQACVTEFVEMTPNRELNYCCGGGGGMLMEEMMELRMKLAGKKAKQLQDLGKLDVVAAPCASCKAQFPHVIKHYKLPIAKVSGVMDILGTALQL